MDGNVKAHLERSFTYHPPKPGQPEKYEALRNKAKELAYLIDDLCPTCDEQFTALKRLGESIMYANAAIARHE